MTSIQNLVSRYVAVWNEPDPARRRQAIAALWTEDGAHFTPSLEARGYEAIEARITGAHDRFVRTEGYVFSAAHSVALSSDHPAV
jgi:SnoaL-like protein